MRKLSRIAEPPGQTPNPVGRAVTAVFAVAFVLAVLALSAAVSWDLVFRGVTEDHGSWIALGGVVGAMWTLMFVGTVRRRGAPR